MLQIEQCYTPVRPPTELIKLVHTCDYVQAYCQGTLDPKAQRRIGLPWSPALANRTCVAVGGTILTWHPSSGNTLYYIGLPVKSTNNINYKLIVIAKFSFSAPLRLCVRFLYLQPTRKSISG